MNDLEVSPAIDDPFVTVVTHPLVSTQLGVLRSKLTTAPQFRYALRELSRLLVYEATRELPVEDYKVQTPLEPVAAQRLVSEPLLVPILRAGLGMSDAAQLLLPNAQMGFVGLKRDESTHQPVSYLESVPDDLRDRSVLILDPMLATGGSLVYCASLFAQRNARDIQVVCVLASPQGIERLRASSLVTRIVTASIDDGLNENAFIVPGLGDAGDRQFGEI